MKKQFLALTAILIICALSLTACGGGSSPSVPADPSEAPASSAVSEDAQEPDAAPPADSQAGDVDPVLAEMLSETQEAIELLKSAMGDAMDIDLTARGSSLIYTFTLLMDLGELGDDERAAVDAQVDSMSSVFDTALEEMAAKGVSSPSVIVEYIDINGLEIYSREFK